MLGENSQPDENSGLGENKNLCCHHEEADDDGREVENERLMHNDEDENILDDLHISSLDDTMAWQ